jgi:hypothetical protein|tara:strand:+ start:1333 stop:1515 length:183 start_codon:yes stop_codon:yes gene_type:complete
MIEGTHIDKFIEQMTFSFINAHDGTHDGEQIWFPWICEPQRKLKPRKRTTLRKKKTKKND